MRVCIDVRALELENSLKQIEFGSQTQTPLKYQAKLRVERSKEAEADVAVGRWKGLLYLYVQNVSKKIIYINAAKIEQYIGELSEAQDKLYIRRFNPPDENIGPIELYMAGQTISFAGTGTDAEDGQLPSSAFTWRIDFHHDQHTHPAMPATSGITSGTYTIPDSGETSANVFYRIHLTVQG